MMLVLSKFIKIHIRIATLSCSDKINSGSTRKCFLIYSYVNLKQKWFITELATFCRSHLSFRKMSNYEIQCNVQFFFQYILDHSEVTTLNFTSSRILPDNTDFSKFIPFFLYFLINKPVYFRVVRFFHNFFYCYQSVSHIRHNKKNVVIVYFWG